MLRQMVVISLVAVGLTGCAAVKESRFNPLNWFGAAEDVVVTEDGQQVRVLPTLAPRVGYPSFTDTRPLVPSVDQLSIAKSASGGIITASATLPALGYYDAQLVPVPADKAGVLQLEFRIRPPATNQGVGSAHQRTITAARSLSFEELAGISRIVVIGANGAKQVRR